MGGKTNGRSLGKPGWKFDTSGNAARLPTEVSRIPGGLDEGNFGRRGNYEGGDEVSEGQKRGREVETKIIRHWEQRGCYPGGKLGVY